MAIQSIAREGWKCFWQNFAGLLAATAPYIVATIVLGIYSSSLPPETSMIITSLIGLIGLVLTAMVNMAGLRYLYALDGTDLDINLKKIIVYILAMLYIGLAIMFGLIFFIVPGILIMVVSFLVPIYILKDSQGPVEAVASSASLIKDDLLVITLFLGAIFLVIIGVPFLVSYLLGNTQLPQQIAGGLSNALSLIMGLYTLPIMKLMYSDINRNSEAEEQFPDPD